MRNILFICLIILMCGCVASDKTPDILRDLPEGVQAVSLLGDTLYTPELSEAARSRFETNLSESNSRLAENPGDADALIWTGRWTAYKGNYREAVDIYTKGIKQNPKDARFYRHRGHRYISIREFSRAIDDYELAVNLIKGTEDKVEPDGLPNSRNIPVSSLHSNIWYHLGLAHYLRDDMELALYAYRECLKTSNNPDNVVSSSNWLYMILRRLGREDEANKILEPIHTDMDIIENGVYHRLLLFYKGELTLEELKGDSFESSENAAVAYGIGNWHYYNGNAEDAENVFREIITWEGWSSFGFIAAEADLSRMN